ncbi:MAG: RNA-binding S4 domain-containing protein [Actinobacteria bacterium]|nr:RNA-binding S4 domain-containing protein [Actinomycetota bacterium]
MRVVSIEPSTRLDQLLKYVDIVSTGGEAKNIIQDGKVLVNDRVEKRRGYKLKSGDVVRVGKDFIKISFKE